MTVLVAVAIALAAMRNMNSGTPVLALVGVGMLLLLGVALVLILGEIRLGVDSERLARQLEREGALPVDPPHVQRRRSGRLSQQDAQALFDLRRDEVQAATEDWRAWFRLALAYGDNGDTSEGRRAMRRAVALHRLGS